FDHSATDLDGDSLVYSLIIPYLGATAVDNRPIPAGSPPYQEVLMKAPFNVSNMMNGSVLLNINSSTGLLRVTPSETGQFVMAILVEEYRDGIKIAEVHRDYQLNVIDCVFGVVSDFQSIDTTCENEVIFNNLSQGLSLSYEWDFGDTSISSDVSDTRNTSWVYENDGKYDVILIVKNQDCTDTFSRTVRILPEKILTASFSIEQDYGCDSLELIIQNLTNSNEQVTWDMGDGNSFTSGNDQVKHVYRIPGRYTIDLSVLDTNSCNQKDDTSFFVTVIESRQNEVSFEVDYTRGCLSDGKLSIESSINGDLYTWDLGDGYVVENTKLTEYIYDTEGTYTIKLITNDTGACVYNDSLSVIVEIDKILKNSDGFELYNVFTPQGDPYNDCYQVDISHTNCLDLKYKIYNRYGEVVFVGESVNDCWDGTHYRNGNSLPASEYFGVFTFTPEGGESFVISNIISLIR
ncbi:MAG: PKD domain-containing protein, partial [Bacteroidia bacterium]